MTSPSATTSATSAGPRAPTGSSVAADAESGTPPAAVELSVVLPCLDEAATLATCIRKARSSFAALGVVGEVIIADNGSTDGSRDIARREGATVVEVSRRGYGAALMAGIPPRAAMSSWATPTTATPSTTSAVPAQLRAGANW